MVVRLAINALKISNADTQVIDYDDMVYLPLFKRLRFYPQDWVLIDEAQDTNPTRREMARRMLKPGGRLIAVGDPFQAIYGFSGADNDSLDQIRRDFDCRVLPLTVTYRCPKNVVEIANQWVPDIVAHETAPEGISRELPYDQNFYDEVRPGDAILCRYNKYLVGTCFRLIRMGKPARIEGRAIGAGLISLINKWKVEDLGTLEDRIRSWCEREVRKATAKRNERKVREIEDRAETLCVLIEKAKEDGINTPAGLKKMVEDVFDDRVVDRKDMVTLCSVHRSKGLEWKRVYVLGLYELMGRECAQTWQTQQEFNLQYVAATRAMEELVNVIGIREEKHREAA
jgi:superfamily I DNA/RNA helicase